MKPTYYDVLKERDTELNPSLVEYVRRDVQALKENDFGRPVRSPDDVNKLTDNYRLYIKSYLEKIAKSVHQNMLDAGMGPDMAKMAERQFLKSPDIKQVEQSCTLDYLSVLNFELYDRKTFYISNGLAEHLTQTKLDAPSEYVRLPFPSCLFFYTEHEVIKAFSRVVDRQPDLTVPISVFASSVPAEEGDRKIILACWQANYERNLAVIKRELLVREDWSIDRMLKTDWHDIYEIDEGPDDSDFYGGKNLDFFRTVLNTILYLASNDPDIVEKLSNRENISERIRNTKSNAKLRKLRKRAKSLSALDYKLVGSGTDSIKVRKPSQSGDQHGVKTNKYAKRILVRGHWRNQPYGEGMSKRKLIWIKPYYRGPDMAEVVNKPYDVK